MRKHTITRKDVHSLSRLEKKKHHHIVHKIHKKHKISYKTLFYMKEYGPRSHVATVILKESIKIMLLASIISSVGGMSIKYIETAFISFLPLLIMLPAMTDMIGDFGIIVASKFTTMLYLKEGKSREWLGENVGILIKTIFKTAIISSVYLTIVSYAVAMVKGFLFTWAFFTKLLMISVIATVVLVSIIILVAIIGGLWIYSKNEDPNNFLIPITTSVGDFTSMLILAIMAIMLV